MCLGSQIKMIQKRGGNLSAPLPKGEIGKCGYLNEILKKIYLSILGNTKLLLQNIQEKVKALNLYSDVGLEDPGTVFRNTKENTIENSKIN